jgi:hypothetical protein
MNISTRVLRCPIPSGVAAAVFFGTVVLSGGGCSAQEPTVASPRPESLPLLGGADVHLYVREAFEGFAPSVEAAVGGRYDELVAAGMDAGRHLFDWRDLETSPGVYDTQLVEDAMLDFMLRGIDEQFCNVVIVDSEGLVVPDYIQALLDSGVPWDDDRIADPLLALLDEFAPRMLQSDMYMLGLGNEPGGYFEDEPAQAASFPSLIGTAIQHVHSAHPELACTVVFAGPDDPSLTELMPLLDVAAFNIYFYESVVDSGCTLNGMSLSLFESFPASEVAAQLDLLEAAADGRLICIQEIGQSTGWDDMPETLGPLAGLENQRACFAALYDELLVRAPRFRSVCLWTLNDFSRAGLDFIRDALIAEGFPACFADNFAEIFGPTGLVRSDATASKKPAFDELVDALGEITGR